VVLGGLLLLAAIVCGVIAATTWNHFGIEGVYLNRSVGKPAYSGVGSSEGEVNGPRILLGAAIGLGVAAALVIALSLSLARRPAPAPPAAAADPGQ
jgi:hypothetical protein